MANIIPLQYSFLRKEIDNSIVLIIDMPNQWQDKDIDFRLLGDKLEVFFPNPNKEQEQESEHNKLEQCWQMTIDSPMVLEHLKYKSTAVIVNAQEQGVAELILEPFAISEQLIKNKVKSSF